MISTIVIPAKAGWHAGADPSVQAEPVEAPRPGFDKLSPNGGNFAGMTKYFLCAILLALLAPLTWAAEPQQPVDPDRLYRLTSELRCLVCQNESLADSNAPLAIDLKNEVRSRMAAGESDEQIKKFLVDRYGNFVIYRPPFNAATLLLWLGPLLLALIGILAVWRAMRASRAGNETAGAEDETAPPPEESAP